MTQRNTFAYDKFFNDLFLNEHLIDFANFSSLKKQSILIKQLVKYLNLCFENQNYRKRQSFQICR